MSGPRRSLREQQLPRLEAEAGEAFDAFHASISAVETWLHASGRIARKEDAEPEASGAQADGPDPRVAELEARVAELEAALAAAGTEPPPADGATPAAATTRPVSESGPKARGFPVPDLSGVEAERQGALDDGTLVACMMQLAGEGATGMITLALDDGRTRYGFWSRGGPVGWRTDPIQENEVLGVLLYKAGQLTKEQLADSVERMEQDGLRQGEALMEMGLVGFSQLTMILGKQCEFVLSRALAERQGRWTFHPLNDLPERFLPSPIRVPSLLFRQEVQRSKQMPSTELADYMRPRIDEYVHFRDDYKPLLREVKFTAAEAKLLTTMQGDTWRTREVLTVSPLSKQN
ncbi:MAG: hypothetical protein VX000_10175, partial [Myxococcota bacterium]|nr:hypothetical protein [Myxococcota bacterium]